MNLFTKELEKQLQKQYKDMSNDPFMDYMDQLVLAKFFHPYHSWEWYLINQDPDDKEYLWGIVNGNFVEVGSFFKSDLESIKINGLFLERDLSFAPVKAKELHFYLLKKMRE